MTDGRAGGALLNAVVTDTRLEPGEKRVRDDTSQAGGPLARRPAVHDTVVRMVFAWSANREFRGLLLVLVGAIAALLHGSALAATPDKVRLQLKWFHQFQFAGYYAAQSKGFYRDEGLDVELLAVGGSNEVAIQIGSGNAEIGEASPAQAVIGMQEGSAAPLDVRYYYNAGYRNIWSISVPSDSPVKAIADLKGKKIGLEVGLVEHLMLLNALKKNGLKESDVEIVNTPTNQTFFCETTETGPGEMRPVSRMAEKVP